MQRVPLAETHVAALRAVGVMASFDKGEMIAEAGEPADRFVYVQDGEIEVVNPYTDERRVPASLGPTQFMGEIALLYGGNWSMPMRAARDTRALVVPRAALLRLMSEIPEMSDIIITVFAARRRRQLDTQDGTLKRIATSPASPRSPAATAFPIRRTRSAAPRRCGSPTAAPCRPTGRWWSTAAGT